MITKQMVNRDLRNMLKKYDKTLIPNGKEE